MSYDLVCCTPQGLTFLAFIPLFILDGCQASTDEPIDSRFPNITLTLPETEIGTVASYTCPCQNLTNTKESDSVSGSRVCGGSYSNGALWDPVNVIEDCGLSSITLQLCQAQIVRTLLLIKTFMYESSYTPIAEICIV